MRTPYVHPAATDRDGPRDTRLRGERLLAARALWAIGLLATTGYAIAVLAAGQERAALARLGLASEGMVAYFNALEILRGAVALAVALAIFWLRSDDAMALLTSFGLGVAAATIPSASEALAFQAVGRIPSDFLVGVSLLTLFYYVFPDGRFVPRWSRWLLLVWLAFTAATLLLSPPLEVFRWPPLLQFALVMTWLGSGIAAQLYRYARVSGPSQRQQTKWVVFGAVVTYAGAVLFVVMQQILVPAPPPAAALAAYAIWGAAVRTLCLLALPVTMGVAVLRYRLWDIDPIIGRTLLYGALTGSVVVLYALVVGFLGVLFQSGGGIWVALIATGVVAVAFQPLRARLQRGINRLLYGERDDPYAVVARLGERMEATLAPDAVLPALVETVAQALRIPYAAVQLRQSDVLVTAAEYAASARPGELVALPLAYQGEPVGRMLLAPRAPGERFSRSDRRLLEVLTHQAGVAAHAVRLTKELQQATADLQRSREQLVTAREEERRRIRRDLHDGIGPTLASMVHRLDRAEDLVAEDPEAAGAALQGIKEQVRGTLGEIRRLVYSLRPPALDEFGLTYALREQAAQFNQPGGLQVELDLPERLPPLPAAVEVAAYRIALEALTNVARHAGARRCRVTLALAGEGGRRALSVEVVDDGAGLSEGVRAGVGLTSIRERAEELGGTYALGPAPGGGARLCAWLPAPHDASG